MEVRSLNFIEFGHHKGDWTYPALHDCKPTCTRLIDAAYIRLHGNVICQLL